MSHGLVRQLAAAIREEERTGSPAAKRKRIRLERLIDSSTVETAVQKVSSGRYEVRRSAYYMQGGSGPAHDDVLLSSHPTKKAAILAAEKQAKSNLRPIHVLPNGVENWAKYGVFDSKLHRYIGFAKNPHEAP